VKKLIIHIILLLLLPATAWVQPKVAARVSATGKLSGGGRAVSLPVSIDKTSDCLRLNSGLAVYLAERGTGSFVLACKTNTETPDVEIKLFPNPVYTYGRLVSMALLTQERQLSIGIFDAAGRNVMNLQRPADQLYAGMVIEMSRLGAGYYFLRIDGQKIHRVIPFVKIN
jgi:hypothetical protein